MRVQKEGRTAAPALSVLQRMMILACAAAAVTAAAALLEQQLPVAGREAGSGTSTAGAAAALASHNGRRLLQTAPPPAAIASCGVSAAQVGSAFDVYSNRFCFSHSDVAREVCCISFLWNLQAPQGQANPITGEPLPAFQEPCRARLRATPESEVCRLVQREPVPFAVLQPLLDRCAALRAPCAPPPPPPACDTSVATIEAGVATARDALQHCNAGGVTRQCAIDTTYYECPQSGVCEDGSRCSFAPSRSGLQECCDQAVVILYAAVPCLDKCALYRASRTASSFLTACTDASAC